MSIFLKANEKDKNNFNFLKNSKKKKKTAYKFKKKKIFLHLLVKILFFKFLVFFYKKLGIIIFCPHELQSLGTL
jgi:hypothetical protein